MDRKGFYAIASSDDLSAAEIHNLYGLRDASEKQCYMLKSQLGSNVTRVYSRRSIESKLAVAFMTSVIRTEILIACRKLNLDVNQMIRHCDRCQLMLLPDGLYAFVDNLSARLKHFFGEFGITPEILKRMGEEINVRLGNAMQSQIRRMPQVNAAPNLPEADPARKSLLRIRTSRSVSPDVRREAGIKSARSNGKLKKQPKLKRSLLSGEGRAQYFVL